MCYQLTKLLEELKSNLFSTQSWWGDNDEYMVGRDDATKDIIKRIEEMLVTSNCKGGHLG